MTRVFVAAGGGGDALAAALIQAATAAGGEAAALATYAWERLRADPRPGPRSVDDFAGLQPWGSHNHVITPDTAPVSPAGSTLPRLAGDLAPSLVLLDPYHGAQGLAGQLGELTGLTGAERLEVVDVGGDVLARGDEPGLRSPLADALALAACTRLDTPARLLVAGPGFDGELSEADVLARVDPEPVVELTAGHVGVYARVLDWHPSEATGLLAAAARGTRGTVEIRDQSLQVALSDHSRGVYQADWATVAAASKLVSPLRETGSLGEAEEHTRRVVGFCELDTERRKAARLAYRPGPEFDVSELHRRVADFEANARARGADYVTLRRLAEALDLSPADRAQLLRARPDQPTPSLWSVKTWLR